MISQNIAVITTSGYVSLVDIRQPMVSRALGRNTCSIFAAGFVSVTLFRLRKDVSISNA